MRPLVCVRHQASAPLGILEDVLAGSALPFVNCDAWQCEQWPEVDDVSGLVVLGGEMNVDAVDRYPFLEQVRNLTADVVAAGKPMLGICLGAQVLARSLGAEVRRSPVREVGFTRVRPTPEGERDPVMSPFTKDVPVFQFHEDTFDLPSGGVLLHQGDAVRNQSFRVSDNAYGVQFHFEVTREIISDWCDETPDLEETWDVSKPELLLDAETHLGGQGEAARRCVEAFLEVTRSVRGW
jgi:GMP synthase (glutamine-hydrolysing)